MEWRDDVNEMVPVYLLQMCDIVDGMLPFATHITHTHEMCEQKNIAKEGTSNNDEKINSDSLKYAHYLTHKHMDVQAHHIQTNTNSKVYTNTYTDTQLWTRQFWLPNRNE